MGIYSDELRKYADELEDVFKRIKKNNVDREEYEQRLAKANEIKKKYLDEHVIGKYEKQENSYRNPHSVIVLRQLFSGDGYTDLILDLVLGKLSFGESSVELSYDCMESIGEFLREYPLPKVVDCEIDTYEIERLTARIDDRYGRGDITPEEFKKAFDVAARLAFYNKYLLEEYKKSMVDLGYSKEEIDKLNEATKKYELENPFFGLDIF